jgi:hypothetical protein
MSTTAIDRQQLENLTREELIVLVEALLKENAELKARLAALEAELAKLKKPPTTSRNSSQPPSRDPQAGSGREEIGSPARGQTRSRACDSSAGRKPGSGDRGES